VQIALEKRLRDLNSGMDRPLDAQRRDGKLLYLMIWIRVKNGESDQN
jgi:hypothetical protein